MIRRMIERKLLRWKAKRHRRRVLNNLPPGTTFQSLLAEAPYEYVHFQGEDGWRIYRQGGDQPLEHAYTRDYAEFWIVDRWLQENYPDEYQL